MVTSFCNIGQPVSNRTLILNLLCDLNEHYNHLWTWTTLSIPFLSFHKVHNDLIFEELTKGAPLGSDATTALYSSTLGACPRLLVPALFHSYVGALVIALVCPFGLRLHAPSLSA